LPSFSLCQTGKRCGSRGAQTITAGAQEDRNQMENHNNSIHREMRKKEETRGGVVDLLRD